MNLALITLLCILYATNNSLLQHVDEVKFSPRPVLEKHKNVFNSKPESRIWNNDPENLKNTNNLAASKLKWKQLSLP